MISVSDPNPVLVHIILSGSENYPQVHYDAQDNLHFCAVSKHDWMKQSHDKFETHILFS